MQRGAVRTAVVRDPGECRVREHVVGQQVLQPQLDRINTQRKCHLIDSPLEQGRRLGAAGTAIRPHRRGVGGRDGDVELDGREPVRALRHTPRTSRQEGTNIGVGAAIADEMNPQTGERAVVLGADLHILHLTAAVHHAQHVFAAGGNPGDGAVQTQRTRGHHGLLAEQTGLATETATDVRDDHVDLAGGNIQRSRKRPMQEVRHLRAAVERETTIRCRFRRRRMRLHRGDRHALIHIAATHDNIGVGEVTRQCRIVRRYRHIVGTLLIQQRCPVGECTLGVDRCDQWFVVHHDSIRCVACLCDGLSQHDSDRFAHIAHLVGGQRWLEKVVVHLGHPGMSRQAEVGSGEHRNHTRHLAGCLDIHARQTRMCHLGAHEHRVCGVHQLQVVDVSRRPQ
ncbi:unannotated protein [freshwater metagenome]|uniref:Unannotated protein n=1 Tax=freshwater metagenome TaxID=449393 RepID=A0A6J6YSG6_9ZZZZ